MCNKETLCCLFSSLVFFSFFSLRNFSFPLLLFSSFLPSLFGFLSKGGGGCCLLFCFFFSLSLSSFGCYFWLITIFSRLSFSCFSLCYQNHRYYHLYQLHLYYLHCFFISLMIHFITVLILITNASIITIITIFLLFFLRNLTDPR